MPESPVVPDEFLAPDTTPELEEDTGASPFGFDVGYEDGYADAPNAIDEYDRGYQEGQEDRDSTDSQDEFGPDEFVGSNLDEAFDALNRLKDVRSEIRATLSSDKLTQDEYNQYYRLAGRVDAGIERQQAAVDHLQGAVESNFLSHRPDANRDHFLHEAGDVDDIGQDDGTFLYAEAKKVQEQARSYDWKRFATVGAQQWFLEQPEQMLADKPLALAAAREFASNRAAVIGDPDRRRKVVSSFVQNISNRLNVDFDWREAANFTYDDDDVSVAVEEGEDFARIEVMRTAPEPMFDLESGPAIGEEEPILDEELDPLAEEPLEEDFDLDEEGELDEDLFVSHRMARREDKWEASIVSSEGKPVQDATVAKQIVGSLGWPLWGPIEGSAGTWSVPLPPDAMERLADRGVLVETTEIDGKEYELTVELP